MSGSILHVNECVYAESEHSARCTMMPVDYRTEGQEQVLNLHLLEGKLLVHPPVIVVDDDGGRVILLAARHVEDLVGKRHAIDAVLHCELPPLTGRG